MNRLSRKKNRKMDSLTIIVIVLSIANALLDINAV